MCGINGLGRDDPQEIERMNRALYHRGPDAHHIYHGPELSLGHTLLAIRSASAEKARQPLFERGHDWVLAFNGEIYNTREICSRFALEYSEIDTLVLYRLIQKIGLKFIHAIAGMYAIALYHKETKRLHLYRDPSGQKGLFYTLYNKTFYFSSEIKALPKQTQEEFCHEGVRLALHLGHIPAPRTLFKKIHCLLPSEHLEIQLPQNIISSRFIQQAPKLQADSPHQAIQQTVLLHTQTKQKIGINLSGGLDSSIILHEASKANIPLETYTTRFETRDALFNEEADLAKKLAQDYQTHHHEVMISKQSYFDNFEKSFELIEGANLNIGMPHYALLAAQEGRQNDKIRVLLAGDGGDEVFCGYHYYYQKTQEIEKYLKWMPNALFNALKAIRTGSFLHYENPIERWYSIKKLDLAETRQCTEMPALLQRYEKLFHLFPAKTSPIYHLMLCDRLIWQASENFMRTDKIFMNESIEVRSPFAYHPLRVYFDERLTDRDYINATQNKLFLRDLYKNKLPNYITLRERKWGWKPPLVHWYDNHFRELFYHLVNFGEAGEIVNWPKVAEDIVKSKKWPGRPLLAYLSLAILKRKYRLGY